MKDLTKIFDITKQEWSLGSNGAATVLHHVWLARNDKPHYSSEGRHAEGHQFRATLRRNDVIICAEQNFAKLRSHYSYIPLTISD
jgi:hypothetical protein